MTEDTCSPSLKVGFCLCLPFPPEILLCVGSAWTGGLQPWGKKTTKKPPTEMTVSSLPSSNLDHTHECGVPDQFWPDWRRMRCWPVGTRWPSGFHTTPMTSGCKENTGRCDRFKYADTNGSTHFVFLSKRSEFWSVDLKRNGIKWIWKHESLFHCISVNVGPLQYVSLMFISNRMRKSEAS